MNNQNNQKFSPIDLSEFPSEKEEKPGQVFPEPRAEKLGISWSRRDKKTRFYTIIIGVSILITLILIFLLFKSGEKEGIYPSQYAPPAEEGWQEYAPSYP